MRQHKLLFPTRPRTFGTFVATTPGEVVQIDIKSFGSLARDGGKHETNQRRRERERIGSTQLYMAVDAASRHAFVQVRQSLGTDDCIAFLEATLAHFDARGIRVQRVPASKNPVCGAPWREPRSRWCSPNYCPVDKRIAHGIAQNKESTIRTRSIQPQYPSFIT